MKKLLLAALVAVMPLAHAAPAPAFDLANYDFVLKVATKEGSTLEWRRAAQDPHASMYSSCAESFEQGKKAGVRYACEYVRFTVPYIDLNVVTGRLTASLKVELWDTLNNRAGDTRIVSTTSVFVPGVTWLQSDEHGSISVTLVRNTPSESLLGEISVPPVLK